MMAYKNVIFDIDGTMVDGFMASNKSLGNALKQVTGKDYDFETLSLHYGIPTSRFFELLGVEYNEQVEEIIFNEYRKVDNEAPLFENILELLTKLKEQNIRLGIVTSRHKGDWDEFLRYEIDHFFESHVIADDTKLHKPNPEPMFEILKRMNIKPEETIYIGDTSYDRDCANGASVKFGLAKWGTHDKELTGDYNLDSPLDILELVK